MTDLISVTQSIYAAFGRGDIAAILECLSDDIAWESWADNHAQRAGVAWLMPRRGREAVAGFFGEIARFEIHDFQVLSLMAGERQVAAELVFEGTPPGGRRFRDEEIHLWSFDGHGRVCRFRHYVDTAKQIAATGER